jgi:hypothetical protein
MVIILKDGQAAGVAVASDTGFFQVTITGVSAGDYTIQASASVLPFPPVLSNASRIKVIEGATTKIQGLLARPIITSVIKNEMTLDITGITAPLSRIVFISGNIEITEIANGEGVFNVSLPQVHILNLTSIAMQVVTPQGAEITFIIDNISNNNVSTCENKIATNDDCRIDIIDFARAVRATITGLLIGKFDYDENGKLDLVDFSIMAFYWTG